MAKEAHIFLLVIQVLPSTLAGYKGQELLKKLEQCPEVLLRASVILLHWLYCKNFRLWDCGWVFSICIIFWSEIHLQNVYVWLNSEVFCLRVMDSTVGCKIGFEICSSYDFWKWLNWSRLWGLNSEIKLFWHPKTSVRVDDEYASASPCFLAPRLIFAISWHHQMPELKWSPDFGL